MLPMAKGKLSRIKEGYPNIQFTQCLLWNFPVKKRFMALFVPGMQKKLLRNFCKFSFQALNFVTNITKKITIVLCHYGFILNIMVTDNKNIWPHKENCGIYTILPMRYFFCPSPYYAILNHKHLFWVFYSNHAKTMVSSSHFFSIAAKPKWIEIVVRTIT